MKIFIKISVVILYLLFSQVYPFAHLHAHEHQDQIELELSLHPPEFPVENHPHEEHKDESHEQDDTYFIGDRNYTPSVKNVEFKFIEQHFTSSNILAKGPKELKIILQENPYKTPEYFLDGKLSERAPPHIC